MVREKKRAKVKRVLRVFSLAMINVAAVSSVRNWPTIAECGLACVFFFALAAFCFFIPVSLVSAELATGWPCEGGVFAWVKTALGHRLGFLAIWLLWLENVVYYPALLSFIIGTLSYVFCPEYLQNPLFTASMVVGIFWVITACNLLGMKISSGMSTAGVLLGTFVPAVIIITLAALWYFSSRPLAIDLSWHALIPSLHQMDNWVFFAGVLMALGGLEMSAVHAKDVYNPQKNYPKAIFLSAIVIFGLYVLGVLSIVLVVPSQEMSLVAGSLQAFSVFIGAYGLQHFTPIMALLLAIGALGTLSTWIAGPSKGLLAAAQEGDLPKIFARRNARGMPTYLLLAQGVIVSLLAWLFVWMPSINSGYWILNAMAVQLYLLMYMLLFISAVVLRYTHPQVVRAYRVPFGMIGIWCVSIIGFLGCLATFCLGFIPPTSLSIESVTRYVLILGSASVFASFLPFILRKFARK